MNTHYEDCERWLSSVRTLCRNRVGPARSRVSTQDLAQEVAAQLAGEHENWHRIGGSYLQRVICGTAAKARRFHSQQRRDTAREQPLADTHVVNLSPHSILEKREVEAQAAKALLELEKPDQQVVVLRFFEELTFREIAERLHISVRQAELALQRGLQRLENLVATEPGSP